MRLRSVGAAEGRVICGFGYTCLMETEARYTGTAIFMHWLLALLLLGQIAFGWYLQQIPRGTPDRTVFVNMHKSFGMVLGVLILFRLYWRLAHMAPLLPASLAHWERTAARISHGLLYACMLIMPLSGYLASNFSKYGVNFFNSVKLPPWGVEDQGIYAALNGVHVSTSFVFVGIIVVHALAALKHALQRDGVFSRMWPAAAHGDSQR